MIIENLSPLPSHSFVIFLDIDGVLYNTPDQNAVFKKAQELFPQIEDCYDNRVCSIAASHFFNKQALKNLDHIIAEIEKIRKVSIVISSRERTELLQNLNTHFLAFTIFQNILLIKLLKKFLKIRYKIVALLIAIIIHIVVQQKFNIGFANILK
jgi:hypothetical protein